MSVLVHGLCEPECRVGKTWKEAVGEGSARRVPQAKHARDIAIHNLALKRLCPSFVRRTIPPIDHGPVERVDVVVTWSGVIAVEELEWEFVDGGKAEVV